MNNRTTIFAAALGLLLAASGFAQAGNGQATPPAAVLSANAPWHLIFFPAGETTIVETVNSIISGGYIPVGLEVTPHETLGILLVKSGSYTVDSWAILDYSDWNALEAEITGGIQDGFVPMDISRYDDTLAVLWVKTTLQIDGWRISTSSNTLAERTKTINDFQSQGFTLWGMSVNDGLAWYLFLRQPGLPPAGAVSGFSRQGDALQNGLLDASRAGWLPNGLAANESTFYIPFVK